MDSKTSTALKCSSLIGQTNYAHCHAKWEMFIRESLMKGCVAVEMFRKSGNLTRVRG